MPCRSDYDIYIESDKVAECIDNDSADDTKIDKLNLKVDNYQPA